MTILTILLVLFVAILALTGMVLGTIFYGIGGLIANCWWIILGLAIGYAICKRIGSK